MHELPPNEAIVTELPADTRCGGRRRRAGSHHAPPEAAPGAPGRAGAEPAGVEEAEIVEFTEAGSAPPHRGRARRHIDITTTHRVHEDAAWAVVRARKP